MKTVALVGLKTNNLRLPGKNTRLLAGRPLYTYLWDTLRQCRTIDRVLVDSSDAAILALAEDWGFEVSRRDPGLNGPEVTGHDLIAAVLPSIPEAIIAQVFVTTPLLTSATIDSAVTVLRETSEVDSVVTAYPVRDRFWYQDRPVAHDPKQLMGTQFMDPVYREAGFYVFRREAFVRERARVTAQRRFLVTTAEESVDIDVEADFLYAQALLEARRAGSQISS